MRFIGPIVILIVAAAACSNEPVRFDADTLECSGSEGDELEECKERRDQLINVPFNASIAEESVFTDLDTYTTDLDRLMEEGLVIHPDVAVSIVVATKRGYCIEATHSALDASAHSDSTDRRVEPGLCGPDEP